MYDINLRATATTILSIRGVQIPIDLVSSATDSYRRSVVLFKPMSVLTSDPKSEFLYQSSSIVHDLQTPLNHLVRLGYLPRPHHHVSPVLLRSDFTHTQIHWTASFLFSLPHIEAHVRYDLVACSCTIRSRSLFLYDTISWLVLVRYDLVACSCTIRSRGLFLYDINLRATITTILRIRGVQIPIDLVSSATDSYRRSVVLFKPLSVPTSDPKSEFSYQSSSIVRPSSDFPLNHLVRLGYLPRPRDHVSPVLPQS